MVKWMRTTEFKKLMTQSSLNIKEFCVIIYIEQINHYTIQKDFCVACQHGWLLWLFKRAKILNSLHNTNSRNINKNHQNSLIS
ncbi:hypothetical protein BHE18_04430 [Rossellomorea aquimaris]|jgi:hypothetical protein|uniref:Uncharacterized protein n=1 Tax=Rossellomorea aquimaris TaxID=189382 RepID=A0A1J6W2S9_9BACI|nr:hypothetical protein BHE18_04430 [Rossellomorea aquimaris]